MASCFNAGSILFDVRTAKGTINISDRTGMMSSMLAGTMKDMAIAFYEGTAFNDIAEIAEDFVLTNDGVKNTAHPNPFVVINWA